MEPLVYTADANGRTAAAMSACCVENKTRRIEAREGDGLE
jgi:hypothetical protein